MELVRLQTLQKYILLSSEVFPFVSNDSTMKLFQQHCKVFVAPDKNNVSKNCLVYNSDTYSDVR